MSALAIFIQHKTRKSQEKEIKGIQVRKKKKIKLSFFTDGMIVFAGNTKEFKYPGTREFSKVLGLISVQMLYSISFLFLKKILFLYTIIERVETAIEKHSIYNHYR